MTTPRIGKSLCRKLIATFRLRGTAPLILFGFFSGILLSNFLQEPSTKDGNVSGTSGTSGANHWRPQRPQFNQSANFPLLKFLGRIINRRKHAKERDGGRPGNLSERQSKRIYKGDDTVAENLKEQVRVLCWIMTHPKNHQLLAAHVKATWGKRCNILLFMSTEDDESLPTVNLNIAEGRDELWNKTRGAFKYVYENYYDQANWFMKADDDTYVIVENLRYMLRNYSASDPIWFGSNFKKYSPQGYMSGGAGYVLSKEALRRFVEIALLDEKICLADSLGADEDVEMGICLNNVNVTAGDSRDEYNRWRFFPFAPEVFLGPTTPMDKDFWFWEYIKYPYYHGPDCCSDTAISFHYLDEDMMYVLDYFLYDLKPYGRGWCSEPAGKELILDKANTSQPIHADENLQGQLLIASTQEITLITEETTRTEVGEEGT